MLDQADHLRRLMRDASIARLSGRAPRPAWVAVAGAKGGVGATTIAVNLAVALAREGRHTVLVDGDLGKADAAAMCGARDGHTIGDVLAGRRSVREATQPGPAGVRMLPGAWATGHLTDCDPAAQERLISELAGLSEADWVVVDAGCGLNRVSERFWMAADLVLLITTADSTALMNAYSAIKTFSLRHSERRVRSVINHAAGDREARESHSRLAVACRRFLGWEPDCAACIAECKEVAAADRRRWPFVLSSAYCAAAHAIEQLARELCQDNIKGENIEFQQTIQALQT